MEVFDTPLVRPTTGDPTANSNTAAAASQAPPPAAAQETGKKKGAKDEGANLYKNLGTCLGIEFVLEKPLLNKKKLLPVEKNVRDFVPARITPPEMIFELKSKKALSDYHQQIQDIICKLIVEYQGVLQAILEESDSKIGNGMFSNIEGAQESIDNLLPLPFTSAASTQQEQLRKKNFLFHLNKSGAYFYFKEQLKSSIVEIVREVGVK